MTHIGLFEGIGGFSLAARWAGWHTPVMVEWNPYCQAVLKKNFPDATIFGDIHEFDGRPYTGQFDILTGGFPCQPYSHAGKRGGNDDDRALWPQMLRIIREIKPAWVVGENVAGLLTMDGGHVLRAILSDLENEGYRPEIYSIPAIAVGAPHERERIWIVAHSDMQRCTQRHATEKPGFSGFGTWGTDKINIEDTRCKFRKIGRLWPGKEKSAGQTNESHHTDWRYPWPEHWLSVATRLCRVDDGLPTGVDGTRDLPATAGKKAKGKSHRLEALGNAIVPQVAFEIFEAINNYHP